MAASPKSASQISPGRGVLEQVEDLLFGGAGARNVKDVVIGELYHLGDALPSPSRRLRLPLAQSSVQFLRQSIHDDLLPSLVNRSSEVIDHDSYVVHPFERHGSNLQGVWSAVYETEWKYGPQGGTMKVSYAKKWQNETDNLRKIVLDCDLVEELKWGKPCFTYQKKNVAIIIPLKDACALSFFKGALLKDPKHILQKIGEAQAGRWIKFTSPHEISALQATLRRYLYEAIEVEESGKKVPLKKASEYVVPEELQVRLNAAPEVKTAFEGLTPGRRKSYIFHVSGAKQAKTRAARAEKCVPMILSSRGFNERAD